MDLKTRFIHSWKEISTGSKNTPVLAAVSGGLDSMVMAHLLLHAGIPFAVAHCNFGLRGEASDGDEAFVQEWCIANSITFHTIRFNTQEQVMCGGKSIQETARDLRYDWFRKLAADHNFSHICTAHHADDNAETMLMHLCRGTGIAGLHGIPVRNELIVRPLLFATRKELSDYAMQENIPFREDASNSKDDYLRNALRHHILPRLEELIPGAALRILETSRRIGEAEQLYNNAIASKKKKLLQPRGKDYYVPLKLLERYEPIHTICYELFRTFGFAASQVNAILQLRYSETGKYITSASHRIIRNRDFLIVTALQPAATDMLLIEQLPADITTGDKTFHFSVSDKAPSHFTSNHIACLDMDKISFPLILRRKKAGDYFYPYGMGLKKKKVSRYLTDGKLPLHEKDKVWILESDKRILWIAGHRTDERFKITSRTKQFLVVELR